ncbi:F0F1 ATP synthase subunit gamma [soil metagenome]
MSDSMASLRRKIDSASDLQSVVRTMKAMAASSIGQYEQSVRALADYYRTIEQGLGACFRESGRAIARGGKQTVDEMAGMDTIKVVVFGSDQGLVGQFNDVIADFALKTLSALPGKPRVWAVGERVHARLADAGLPLMGCFAVPNSVKAIALLVGQIQIDSEAQQERGENARFYVFHNRPEAGGLYQPVSQRLLPLDVQWQRNLAGIRWPTSILPEIIGAGADVGIATLRALIREYLYISLFRACAESLASENASRLAAMERADKNIDELLENLHGTFHRLRQTSIDEELFDVISGYESLGKEKHV